MVRAMTTLKPQLVRADTLDLQDPDAPSAKDHTRQPAHASPYALGPHQAQTLRQAEKEAYHQQRTSPRASDDLPNGDYQHDRHFYDDVDDDDEEEDEEGDDDQMNSQHAANANGYHGQDLDDGDGVDSHDEELDDDLMDKISSSPSIEDGKCPPNPWPPRADSVDYGASPASVPTPTRGIPHSLSPFYALPAPAQLRPTPFFPSASHLGECRPVHDQAQDQDPHAYALPNETPEPRGSPSRLPWSESQEFRRYLLPVDDPFLEDLEDYDREFDYDDDEWEDEAHVPPDPESSSEDDDDADHFSFTTDDRFLDSGWGGECLRELEDIDFEFVYALHTFVATVEGQANATKGDTMVLLDDSNSYWWLVRVVKDGSIGYLPAEHIETPTERLARLNKHRNVDLSASMLGDNPEKPKNPLKKAMRRRNAKTVQFSAPTYYEPSEYDFSDEEDDEEQEEGEDGPMDHTAGETADDGGTVADQVVTAAAPIEGQDRQDPEPGKDLQRMASNDSLTNRATASLVNVQPLEQRRVEEPVQRSRKGVVRNTDSFYKDDTVETKKISLTPRLLRGDADSVATESEVRQRPSLETFDKIVGVEDKSKEKKREKKGMFGLFKRKKGVAPEESDKVTEDARQSPQAKESMESLSGKAESGPERKPSKLQKTPPATSPKSSPTEARPPTRDVVTPPQAAVLPAPTGPAPAPPTLRKVESDTPLVEEASAPAPLQSQPPVQVNRFPSLTEKRSIFSPLTNALKSNAPPGPETDAAAAAAVAKPTYSKRAKERFALDDSESDEEKTHLPLDDEGRASISPVIEPQGTSLRSDSAFRVSPLDTGDSGHAGEGGTSSAQSALHSSSPLPHDPNTVDSDGTASTSKPSPSTVAHTPSTSRSTPTWSDASLRSYMENSQDIKDLLIIVHDSSNVVPAGPDHPLMHDLFTTERTKLAEMQTQLDTMLLHWISKKNSGLMSTAS